MNQALGTRVRAFTLVELVVVIAIMAIMIALLLPALSRAKDAAHLSQCRSNLHQVHLSIAVYAVDQNNQFVCPKMNTYYFRQWDTMDPWAMWFSGGDEPGAWAPIHSYPAGVRPLTTYIEPNSRVWRCPADDGYDNHGIPTWDYLTMSYLPNNHRLVTSMCGSRHDEVEDPSLTISMGDYAYQTIWWTNGIRFSANGWHPKDYEKFKVNVTFLDGHGKFIHVIPGLRSTDTYRLGPG